MSRKREYEERRKKEEIKGFLMAAVWGILLGIAVVFASMAMRVVAAPQHIREEENEKEQVMLQEEENKETQTVLREEEAEVQTIQHESKETISEDQQQMQEAVLKTQADAQKEFMERQKEKVLYLTFDDGPSAENTDKVLDVLKKKNVKATFFVIGEYVRKNPETVKRIVEEGHAIGIHCDVHDYVPLYRSVDSYIEDFEKASETVFQVTGVRTRLFRFPGGSVNAYNREVREDIIAEMEKRGYIYFDWNASLEDASGNAKTPAELIRNARETALDRKKVVLLAHDRVESTALALEALIEAFPDYRMEVLTVDVEPVQF